jgi:dephospho-CoA kinase
MQNKSKIIVLCGRIGSGKSTIANYLNIKGYISLSFAECLKEICSILTDINIDILKGETEENIKLREIKKDKIFNMTGRQWLEKIGMMFRNNFDNDFWVKILENKLIKYINNNQNIVITDCRFENEYNMLKKYNSDIWIVYRKKNDLIITDDEYNNTDIGNIGRWGFINFTKNNNNIYIDNCGTKSELYNQINKYLGRDF